MVRTQHATRARGGPTFQDTPSEPLDAIRRNLRDRPQTMHAVPTGARESGSDAHAGALGRPRGPDLMMLEPPPRGCSAFQLTTRQMTKRRKNRTEAQLAAARRGLDAAAAASSHNTAAIVLATAGAPAPPFPRAVSAAIGRFHRTPTTLVLSGLLLQLLPSRLMQRRWTRWTPLRSHHSTPSSLSSRDETSSLS
jgi:hypothetical protein